MIWLLFACTTPAPRPGPDIVLFTVDTLRHDRLGFAGHASAHTPHMDALAARGTVFSQATTPFPRTTPALASLLTGLRPAHHGSLEVGDPMRHGTTLAQRLSQAGWATLGFSGTPVAGPDQGLDAGFDTFIVQGDPRASQLTALALTELSALPPERAVLVWVHVVDPHFPYLPKDPSPGPCLELGERVAAGTLKRGPLFSDHGGLAQGALEHCKQLYDAEVSEADAALGELLAGMRAAGRDPWVALSSDHGEHFGEGGLYFEHGPRVDDAVVRVPMVVSPPLAVAATPHTDSGVARLEDLAVTLLALAGLEWSGLDGVDLSPRLSGAAPPQTAQAWIVSGSALHNVLVDFVVTGRAGRRTCVHGPRWSRCGKGRFSFFDHLLDPQLRRSSQPDPQTVQELERQAQRWPAGSARFLRVRGAQGDAVAQPRAQGGHALLGPYGGAATQRDRLALEGLAQELGMESWAPSQGVEVERALEVLGYVE